AQGLALAVLGLGQLVPLFGDDAGGDGCQRARPKLSLPPIQQAGLLACVLAVLGLGKGDGQIAIDGVAKGALASLGGWDRLAGVELGLYRPRPCLRILLAGEALGQPWASGTADADAPGRLAGLPHPLFERRHARCPKLSQRGRSWDRENRIASAGKLDRKSTRLNSSHVKIS